jgi:hypothetical protein
MRATLAVTIVLVALVGAGAYSPGASALTAQAPPPAPAGERTVWYFYTVRWGAQDEFLDLFQKNHYPVLRAQLKERLTSIKTYVPTYHGDGRADWTFAVALTYRDTAAMVTPSPDAQIAQKLFPDQDLFIEEEHRRFELLDAHWDVPLTEVDFESRKPVGR